MNFSYLAMFGAYGVIALMGIALGVLLHIASQPAFDDDQLQTEDCA